MKPSCGFQNACDLRFLRTRLSETESGGSALLPLLAALHCSLQRQRIIEAIGNQTGGRVGFFLTVSDFDETFAHMKSNGVLFEGEPRTEPYGKVIVFQDLYGNRWDLLGVRQNRAL